MYTYTPSTITGLGRIFILKNNPTAIGENFFKFEKGLTFLSIINTKYIDFNLFDSCTV